MADNATKIFGELLPLSDEAKKNPTAADLDRLIWCDLEMTGLDAEKERIIEMAVCVTDGNLTQIVQGPNLIIHQSTELLNSMDEWNTEHHGNSGLTQSVKDSTISESDCENQMLEFIQKYTIQGKSPLAGNSIYMDKMFLMKYMPKFCSHLHHRLVDVSTVKEIGRRWHKDIVQKAPKKEEMHRALDDIIESIKELQYYRSKLFVQNPSA